MLVLRHRRPIQTPYPSEVSHSLPAFSYDPVTGHITIDFDSDPAYPPPAKVDFELPSPSNAWASIPVRTPAWKQKCYLLTSIPSRRPRTFVDDAADFFTSSASMIAAPFASIPNPFAPAEPQIEVMHDGDQDAKVLNERVSLEHVRGGEFDLLDEEVVEEERPEEAEIDDDPDPLRRVRVIGYRKRTEVPNSKARDRKRWEILPIRKERRRY
jgi:WD repeat-containing protein 23